MEKLHELCYVGRIFVQNRAWNQANIIRYYLFLSTFYQRLNHNVQVTFSLSRYFKRACCRRWRRLSFVLLWHHPIGNLFNVTFCYSKKWCRWRCGKKVREGALGAPTVTGSEKYRMGLKYMAYITNVSLHATTKILNMTASYNGTETVPTEQVLRCVCEPTSRYYYILGSIRSQSLAFDTSIYWILAQFSNWKKLTSLIDIRYRSAVCSLKVFPFLIILAKKRNVCEAYWLKEYLHV